MSRLGFEVSDGVKTIDGLLRRDLAPMVRVMKQYSESMAVGGILFYVFLPLQVTIPDSVSELSSHPPSHP